MVALVLLFGVVQAHAAPSEVWVDPNNSSVEKAVYGTIQEGVNAVEPGGTVHVAAGTYNEDVTIDKSLTLISDSGKSKTVIMGKSNGYTGAVLITSGTLNVTIGGTEDQGFTINGAGQAAVYIQSNVSGVTIQNNELVAAAGKNALLTEDGQSNILVSGNTFSGTGASQLVYVNGQESRELPSTNVNFTNNTFTGSNILSLGQEASDSTITGNIFEGTSSYASLDLWGTGNTVSGNQFVGNLPAGAAQVLDNTASLDIGEVLANNVFDRAVTVMDQEGSFEPKIWSNIQDAVDDPNTGSGDTVIVSAGEYSENVFINKGITLQGTELPVVYGGIEINTDSVTIDGFEINNGGLLSGSQPAGIYVVGGTSGHTISNNILMGSGNEPSSGPGIIFGYDTQDITVENNDISNWYQGIYINPSSNLVFDGNNIYDNYVGIGSDGLNTVSILNNEFTNNILEGFGYSDVDNVGGNVVVQSNTFTGNATGVANYSDYLLNISNNTFIYNNIPFEPFDKSLIDDNTFIGRVDVLDAKGNLVALTQNIQAAVDRAGDGYTLNVYAGTYEEQVLINGYEADYEDDYFDLTLTSIDGPLAARIDSTGIVEGDTVSELRAKVQSSEEKIKGLTNPAKQRIVKENKVEVDVQSDNFNDIQPPQKHPRPGHGNVSALQGEEEHLAMVPALAVLGARVTLEDFEITGMYMDNADDSVVTNNRFTDSDYEGAWIYDTDGWEAPLSIRGNKFTGNGWGGLFLDWSYYVKLAENEFTDNGGDGLYSYDSDYLTMVDNTFADNLGSGAYLYDTDGDEDLVIPILVQGNTFSNNGLLEDGSSGLVIDYCWYVTVEGNPAFTGNGYEGIDVYDSYRVAITDNPQISGNLFDGIDVECAEAVTITGNTIANNGWSGILTDDTFDNITIADNEISSNGTGDFAEEYMDEEEDVFAGIEIYNYYGLFNKKEDSTISITGNTIQGNKDAGIYVAAGFADINHNFILNNGHPAEEDQQFGESYGSILFEDGESIVLFNDIVGNTPYGLTVGSMWDDSQVEANNGDWMYGGPFAFNWWGDASGPRDESQGDWLFEDAGGNLLGTGDAVNGIPIYGYAPWLSGSIENLGEPAGSGPVIPLPVYKGWHLVSTPYTLDVSSWADVIAMGEDLDAAVVLRYNAAEKAWELLGGETEFDLDPLDAYFIKLNSNDLLPMAVSGTFTAPPTRTLEQGWNLFGPAYDRPMSVREALVSVEQTNDGKRGWLQVVKPPFPAGLWGGGYSWVTTVNSPDADKHFMPFAGYWIYMENTDEVAGFTSTTPVWWEDYIGFSNLTSQALQQE